MKPLLLLAMSASLAQAQLIVVEDLGGRSATKYYDAIGITPEKPVEAKERFPVSRTDESFVLPIRSEKLTPGPVEPRRINAPGLMTFFIIGDDALSRDWLIERGDRLQTLGAFGLVVNVESLQSLQRLRSLVPELTLSPVPGDDLAQRLTLSHYPALITSTSIEQ